MNVYLIPIREALVIFPIVAAIFTLPYVIHQYRKYGSLLFLRIIIVYSLILYMMAAYFMVILPLPKNDVVHMTTIMQLDPMVIVDGIVGAYYNANSILDFLKYPVVYQAIFNVLLTVPLGVYLRYYFNRKWYQVILIGFFVSLSFEVLQLTGILGIYQHPYRLFDVDDLIVNTIGAFVGFIITPLITFILPSKKQLDHESYIKGQEVSFTRRLVALLIDILLVSIIGICINQFISLDLTVLITALISWLLYFGLLTYLLKGQTIGKRIVKIALVDNHISAPKLSQCLLRYGLLILEVIILPITIYQLMTNTINEYHMITMILSYLLTIIFVIVVFKLFFFTMIGKKKITYEQLSNTHNISVNIIKEKN